MTRTLFKPFFFLTLFVLIVGLACSFGAPDPTPTPVPTQAPTATPLPPTATPVPPTPVPSPTTAPELPTQEPDSPASAFELDSEPYLHPSGLFGFNPPSGWTVTEDTGSVEMEAPDQSGFIRVQVTNTGYTLDPVAFEQFINAREANYFGGFEAFDPIETDISDDVASVTKSLLFDSVPQIVLTVYSQRESAIYAFDFWSAADRFSEYSPAYLSLVDTLSLNRTSIVDQELYLWIYEFAGPGDLFTIDVPTSWLYENDTSDNAVVDTFYSPDNHAVIQNIGYDDGTVIDRNVAGEFALTLLRSFYAEDVRITDDQVQADGSERLTWFSPSGEYSGISFFETRGTTFLLFTIVWDDPFEDLYFGVLDYTVNTYTTP